MVKINSVVKHLIAVHQIYVRQKQINDNFDAPTALVDILSFSEENRSLKTLIEIIEDGLAGNGIKVELNPSTGEPQYYYEIDDDNTFIPIDITKL